MWTDPPETVAAVDLGSNSFHMIVANLREGQLYTIDRMKETVRLAAGLNEHRNLNPDAQAGALDCLERFGQRVGDMPHGSVRAVGTNALRRALNASEFLAKANTALGHPIDIISGIEEARLIYLGVANSLASDGNRRLVMDIGGGSTEFIIGTGTTPLYKESLHMGCVSMSSTHFPAGKITAKRMQRAIIAARQQLEPIIRYFSNQDWQEAVGASGTLRAVNKAIQAYGWGKSGISFQGLQKLLQEMLNAGHMEKLQIPGFNADRMAVFPGGVAIAYATFESLGIEEMKVSDGALREGLLYDLKGRIYHDDIRDHSVKALAERSHVDFEHADKIFQTLQFIVDQITLPGDLNPKTALQWLEWATQLHQIGLDIAHSQYHKHGAYIIENADLAGFSRQDQTLLAALVRVHRRKFADRIFDELVQPWNNAARWLAVVLRFAILLHRSHHSDPLPPFKISMNKKRLDVEFPENWIDERPLTQADLRQEAAYLESAGIKLRVV